MLTNLWFLPFCTLRMELDYIVVHQTLARERGHCSKCDTVGKHSEPPHSHTLDSVDCYIMKKQLISGNCRRWPSVFFFTDDQKSKRERGAVQVHVDGISAMRDLWTFILCIISDPLHLFFYFVFEKLFFKMTKNLPHDITNFLRILFSLPHSNCQFWIPQFCNL